MKKPIKPNFIERHAAKKAAQPILDFGHLANVCGAARRSLHTFHGDDLVKMSVSLATCEAMLAQHVKAAPAAAAQPDAKPTDAAPKPAAG